MSSPLFFRKHVERTAFQEALTVLQVSGFHVFERPSETRDGVVACLQKEQEKIWLTWMDDYSLFVTATKEPSPRLKAEVFQVLESANLKKIGII
jgi:hypothetical protein